MARRNDFADIDFFFRFIIEPFRDIRWAAAYIGIAIVFFLGDLLLVAKASDQIDPASPVALLTTEFHKWVSFRLLIPAMCFNAVGALGFVTVLVREWLASRK